MEKFPKKPQKTIKTKKNNKKITTIMQNKYSKNLKKRHCCQPKLLNFGKCFGVLVILFFYNILFVIC
jgi:hypothetical protein